jgi:hypothetical protein
MQAFTVVIALLAVAALGWLLSRAARSLLRRHGVPTDERDVPGVSKPLSRELHEGEAGGGRAPDGPSTLGP